jgi:competence protein ComEA
VFLQLGPKERAAYATVAVLLLVLIGYAGYRYSAKNRQTGSETGYERHSQKSSGYSSPRSSDPESSKPAPTELMIDVAGAVISPGVYKLSTEARVEDAIKAAGGAKDDADLSEINLAATLTDGEQVRVPAKGETASSSVVSTSVTSGASKHKGKKKELLKGTLSLNSATMEQLETLPTVGPATAQRILDYRAAHGSFTRIEELRDVGGIGVKKYAQIAPHVRL